MSKLMAALLAATSIHAYAQSEQPLNIDQVSVRQASPNGGAALVGTAVNTSSKTLGTVILTFNLYDANDTLVGNASAAVSGLEPGARWQFEALTYHPFAKYKVGRVIAQ